MDKDKENFEEQEQDLEMEEEKEEKKISILLVGNTGVGKSFLLNCLLDEEVFESVEKEESVTKKLEFKEVKINNICYKLYNAPGLLEDNDEQVQLNKKIIEQILDSKETLSILFVMTNQAGRIQSHDLEAFNALNAAYKLKESSLNFVVNKYKGSEDLKPRIEHRIKSIMLDKPVYFLSEYKETSKPTKQEKENFKLVLTAILLQMNPKVVIKIKALKLIKDEIKDIIKASKMQQDEYKKAIDENASKFQKEIEIISKQAKIREDLLHDNINKIRQDYDRRLIQQPQVVKEVHREYHHHHQNPPQPCIIL